MTGRARKFLLTALVVLLAAADANAQRRPVQPFKITDIGGEIFVNGNFRYENQTRSSNTTLRERDVFFEEGMNLDIGSYIYHPNFVDLLTSFTVGLTQKRLKINDDRSDSDGTLLGYDVTAAILKEKPLSGRLFASQSDNVLDRNFSTTFDLETSRYGFELFLRGDVPVSLTLERLTRREEDEFRITDEQTDHLLVKISDRRDPDWYTELTYDHEDTDEPATFFSPGGVDPTKQDLSIRQDELNLLNQWRFGSGPSKHRLSGHSRALRRRGIFDNDTLSIDQQLDLFHTDTFSTFYRGGFHSDEINAEKEESITGEIGFTKRVYDSLDITARGYATNTDFNDGFEKIWGGDIDIDYRKKTPIGLYSSAVRVGLECESERKASGQRSIVNENVHLVGTQPTQLEFPNVVSPLLVTNLAMTVIYVENIDYVVTGLGAFTEISRTVISTMGDDVLVSYNVRAARDTRFQTNTFHWSGKLRLKGLPFAVYALYDLQDQELKRGEDPGNLEQRITRLAGIEMVHKGLKIYIEREQQDQELSPPWIANRVNLTYLKRLRRNVDLSLNANAEWLDFREAAEFGLADGEDFEDTQAASARITTKLRRNMLMRFNVGHIRTRGRVDNRLTNFGVSLDWRFGDIDFSVEALHNIFDREGNDGDRTLVLFSIRRQF